MFAVTWLVALSVWRFGHVEQRWDEAAMRARQLAEPESEELEPVLLRAE
jgi:hypothetical protein